MKKLDELIASLNFKGKRVLVLGDIILDKYIEGDVREISPEAPVPVLDCINERWVLGGAAKVVSNLLELGVDVSVIGLVGDDPEGSFLIEEMKQKRVDVSGIEVSSSLVTTSATRIIAKSQQLLRINRGSKGWLNGDLCSRVNERILNLIHECDGIAVADYNKGFCTPKILHDLVQVVGDEKPIVANPRKDNLKYFKGVSVVTPTRTEASEIIGLKMINETSIRNAGFKIMELLNPQAVLLRWIEDGFHLFKRGGDVSFLPSKVSHISQLIGYGDTVTSILIACLCTNMTIDESAYISLRAAEAQVQSKSQVPISLKILKNQLKKVKKNDEP